MKRPGNKLIITFLLCLVFGYIVSWGVMVGVLETELRLYGFVNVTIVAILVAAVLVIILDSPLNLKTFDWPTEE